MDKDKLLKSEMAMYGMESHGDHVIVRRNKDKITASVPEQIEYLKHSILSQKKMFFTFWAEFSQEILSSKNTKKASNGSTQKIFINACKRLYRMASRHSPLRKYAKLLERVLLTDVIIWDETVMSKVIDLYLGIQWVDNLVREDCYRLRLLKEFVKHHNIRIAEVDIGSVQGPWANLDLPMRERVWSWDEDKEDFEESTKKKQNQSRYQLPDTYNSPDEFEQGFYWREIRNDPYMFGDEENDPYPHRDYLFKRP